MQVKKFEAKTMKEALEMVKNQLGPDAVILGAKDNNKGFGLLGNSSVEVTAAISDSSLKKKNFTESRMPEKTKTQFRSASAKVQRNVVERSVQRYTREAAPETMEVKRALTTTTYADIDDGEAPMVQSTASASPKVVGARVDNVLAQLTKDASGAGLSIEETASSTRIRTAVQKAANTFENKVEQALGVDSRAFEIKRLNEEILGLKLVIDQLKSLPRTFINAHPGAQFGIPFELSSMFESLTSSGVTNEISVELMVRASKEIPQAQLKNKNLIEAWTAHQIMNTITIADHSRFGRVHVFLGGAGQGKTSSLVKLAGLLSKSSKKILIVAAGNLRVGALDQIKIYSHLLNASFETLRTSNEWGRILSQYNHFDHILVDYPGYSLKEESEVAALKSILPPYSDDRRIHFVQSVCSKDDDAFELFRRFVPIHVDDIIFSHLDESANHGLIYNLHRNFNSPLFAFGTGGAVPNDFEWASKERVMDLIFRITNRTEN